MTNNKYYLFYFYQFYDEKVLELLNKMNGKGYELTKVGFFLKFEKTFRKLKYQVDYTPRENEFNQIIHDLGYQHIGSYYKRHIYASENLEAPDLITDQETYKSLLLTTYGFGAIFAELFILGLGFLLAFLLQKRYFSPINLGKIYIHFHQVLTDAYIFPLLVTFIFHLISLLYKRHTIKNNTYSYQKFKTIDFLFELINVILALLYLIACMIFKVIPTLILATALLMIPITAIHYIRDHYIPTLQSNKKRTITTIIAFTIYLIVFMGINNFNTSLIKDTNKSNYFVETTSIQGATIYQCRNEDIANEVYLSILPPEIYQTEIDSKFDCCVLGATIFGSFGDNWYVPTVQKLYLKEDSTVIIAALINDDLQQTIDHYTKLLKTEQ